MDYDRSSSRGPGAMQARAPPAAADMPDLSLSRVMKGAGHFVKEHKTISTTYLLGILLLLFGTGLKVTEQQAKSYDDVIATIDYAEQEQAYTDLYQAKQQYNARAGWFGSCNSRCMPYKQRMQAAQARFDALKHDEAAVTSQAKQQVGIMSEYGVQETRDLFWGTFAGGKEFAKRQSWWDLLFTGLRWGKDEELFSVVLRWLIQLLFNFTLGMIGALAAFVWQLWGLIKSYAPDPATGMLYFALATVAATACVATYLVALYATAAGSVAVVAKAIVDHNHRIGADPRMRERQRVAYQQAYQQQQQLQYQHQRGGYPGGGGFQHPHQQ